MSLRPKNGTESLTPNGSDRFRKLLSSLKKTGTGQLRVVGDSMRPDIVSGCILSYEACDEYDAGDIVFCKVNGRFIDAHRVLEKRGDGSYLIGSDVGTVNGTTFEVFAKVVNRKP